MTVGSVEGGRTVVVAEVLVGEVASVVCTGGGSVAGGSVEVIVRVRDRLTTSCRYAHLG